MRSGILVSLIVAVLCACVNAGPQPAPVSPGDILIMAAGDPNDPNVAVPPTGEDPNRTWDPAEHLVADWESVAVNMGSLLLNPRVRPDVESPGPQWSLSVTAIVDIVDSNGLIAWSRDATSVTAYDQDGGVISSTTSSSPVRMYQSPQYLSRPTGPNGEWESVLLFNQVSLRLPMAPDAVYPDVLSRVEWTMNVLVAEETRSVDLAFEPNDVWVTLVPGMEVLVEKATVEETKYDYGLQLRYDTTQADYLSGGFIHLWNDQQPPRAALTKVEVLNAGGKSIRDFGGGSFGGSGSFHGEGSQRTGTLSGHGTCDTRGTAAILRFTFVSHMYEKEVRLAVENVPVPHF